MVFLQSLQRYKFSVRMPFLIDIKERLDLGYLLLNEKEASLPGIVYNALLHDFNTRIYELKKDID